MRNLNGAHLGLFPAFESAERTYHPGTAQHSARVSRLVETIGRAMGIALPELEALTWAGMLHDIGKLAVPTDILRKPGPLDAEEWVEMRRHPIVGADMLLAISSDLEPVATAVRSHHERWDGTGYPDGLAADDIPLLGRIIAVADSYDALTQPKVYRPKAFSHDDALDLLYASAGSQFDPQVVGAFLSVKQHPASQGSQSKAAPPPQPVDGWPLASLLSIGINGQTLLGVDAGEHAAIARTDRPEPARSNGGHHRDDSRDQDSVRSSAVDAATATPAPKPAPQATTERRRSAGHARSPVPAPVITVPTTAPPAAPPATATAITTPSSSRTASNAVPGPVPPAPEKPLARATHQDASHILGPADSGSGLASQSRTAIPALRILRAANLLEDPDADL